MRQEFLAPRSDASEEVEERQEAMEQPMCIHLFSPSSSFTDSYLFPRVPSVQSHGCSS